MLQSRTLLKWKQGTKYCTRCGSILLSKNNTLKKKCSSCRKVFYPVIYPVGITLITNESNTKALLVRQPRHPPGMYTCVAGFVEVGKLKTFINIIDFNDCIRK